MTAVEITTSKEKEPTTMYAKDLQIGTVLEPDGSKILDVKTECGSVVITLKEPRKRPVEIKLDPHWQLIERVS